jgi:membrane protein implicated in regulation of membrane protease activity
MKNYVAQPGLVLLALGIIAIVAYALPLLLDLFASVPYKFVLFFLVIVAASNVLAKMALRYVNT